MPVFQLHQVTVSFMPPKGVTRILGKGKNSYLSNHLRKLTIADNKLTIGAAGL